MVVFQKVCLDRSLQIPQICKYNDSWFQNNTPRRVVRKQPVNTVLI